jgi:hypothetical protein
MTDYGMGHLLNEFKTSIVLDTAERLRENGFYQEAADLEWDLVVQLLVECFGP